MRRSTGIVAVIGALGVLGVLGVLGACRSDAASGPGEEQEITDTTTVHVSNVLPAGSVASASRMGGSPAGALAVPESDVVYVSLRPGTVPDGVTVVIGNPRTGGTVTAALVDGGFDPVPVRVLAGDSVVFVVTRSAGGERRFSIRVPERKSPRVVRTSPPRGKTGVPLNSIMMVVFSEPVAASTLTDSSVKVLRDGRPVPGTVSLLAGTSTSAVFTPTVPLAPNAEYRLVVTDAVTDLDGDALATRISTAFTTGTTLDGAVNHVVVRPDSLEVPVGAQVQLTARAIDDRGKVIEGLPTTWSSQDQSVASVSPTGLVTARSHGAVSILGTIGGRSGALLLVVGSSTAVATVALSTDSAAIRVGGKQWLLAQILDSAGNSLPMPRPTLWSSSNATVATVADSGSRTAYVTGVREGLAKIIVWVEGKSDTMTILVSNSASIGPSITATTPANGALGVSRRTTVSVTFLDVIDATSLGSPTVFTVTGPSGVVPGVISGSSTDYRTWTFTPALPLQPSSAYTARVTTAVRDLYGNPLRADYVWTFTTEESTALSDAVAITSFAGHTCALTTAGLAWCWGRNANREFGDGTWAEFVWYAVPSGSGLAFTGLSAGQGHSCGVSVGGKGYCWGNNTEGELGNGSPLTGSTVPTPVAGNLEFISLSAGFWHTCGVSPGGAAWCWGNNSYGNLGDGTRITRTVPARVTGGLTFDQVSAGTFHSCGLAAEGAAWCWGNNSYGNLGDGTTTQSFAPVPVMGNLKFTAVSAGGSSTCGITDDGSAWCWGWNWAGQLGDGTTTTKPSPVPVAGALRFISVRVAKQHACGVTVAGDGYCWGDNAFGQLGDGTITRRLAPVLVTGGLRFTAIATGESHSCGVTTDGGVYCWGDNSTGQLGDGSTTRSSVPVRVHR